MLSYPGALRVGRKPADAVVDALWVTSVRSEHGLLRFTMITLLRPLLGSFLVGWTFGAAQGDIVMEFAARGLEISASQVQQEVRGTNLYGQWVESVSANGSGGPFTFLSVGASQDSTTPEPTGLSMFGMGQAFADLSPDSSTAFTVNAESQFEVTFQVSAGGPYKFEAEVSWFGTWDPIFGEARVELMDDFNVLSGVVADDGNLNQTMAVHVLSPGVTYQLMAAANVVGDGNLNTPLNGEAKWSFSLTAVPEAGSAGLLGVVAVGATVAAGVRRSRRPAVASKR
jgi:hypothetical protein